MEGEQISWHPAFVLAMQTELEDYQDVFEFSSEHELYKQPLRIDLLIIKKRLNVVIKKNIAQIFRTFNILEFKGPDDYVSLSNFCKVCGYAWLYASKEKVQVQDITITFIQTDHPCKLLKDLRDTFSCVIETKANGIYTTELSRMPIQIVESKLLDVEKNLWLKSLSKKLDEQSARRILKQLEIKERLEKLQGYLDVVSSANPEIFQEVRGMTTFKASVEKVAKEAGWVEEWNLEKSKQIARNFLEMGMPITQIAQGTGLPLETIRELQAT